MKLRRVSRAKKLTVTYDELMQFLAGEVDALEPVVKARKESLAYKSQLKKRQLQSLPFSLERESGERLLMELLSEPERARVHHVHQLLVEKNAGAIFFASSTQTTRASRTWAPCRAPRASAWRAARAC